METAMGARLLSKRLLPSLAAPPLGRMSLLRLGTTTTTRARWQTRPFSGTRMHRNDQPEGSGAAVGAGAASAASSSTATSASSSSPPSKNPMEGLADLLPSSRDSHLAAAFQAATPLSGTNTSMASASTASADIGAALGSLGSGSGSTGLEDFDRMRRDADHSMEEYHFNVYSHKHNTHITVSKPNRDVIVSLSCGNLGFKKAQRRSYDAAYQLGAYVLDRLYQRGWHKSIQRMEVTLRGFGVGREAVSKVLLGTEGRLLRSKITRVADGTRLKFGGTRSPNPRRLG